MHRAIKPIFHHSGHWAGVYANEHSKPSNTIFRQSGWVLEFACHEFSLPAKGSVVWLKCVEVCPGKGHVAGGG